MFFVVLHYQAYEATCNCIDSLLNLNNDVADINIIIVDNASPNGSGVELQKKYRSEKRIEVVINKSNEGFAKGNNVGFRIAKDKGADFIILINNDTLIPDQHFAEKVLSIYQRTSFGVLGPDILSMNDNVHQNPAKGIVLSKSNISKKIFKAYLILAINRFQFMSERFLRKNRNKNYNNDYLHECEITPSNHLLLHGSCLVFSREYVNIRDGLNDGTFMYYEEDILACDCFKNGIKMIYSPDVKIEHYRSITTTLEKDNNQKRIAFFYKNALVSLKVLRKML